MTARLFSSAECKEGVMDIELYLLESKQTYDSLNIDHQRVIKIVRQCWPGLFLS